MSILAIDLDGVIHNPNTKPPGGRMGQPYPGAKESIEKLRDRGDRIIVHTVRANTMAGTKSVMDWLDYFHIPYHGVTATKPNADWYIDDKAMHHTDWVTTMRNLNG